MAHSKSPKYCIVEGADTSSVLLGLIRHTLPAWKDKATAEVWVEPDGEIQNSLKVSQIVSEFQASGRTHMAFVVDAESDANAVWTKIQAFGNGRFNAMPAQMPKDGLILTDPAGKKFGVWIMPDNQSSGMLEDFLGVLVPNAADPLWQHAIASVAKARAEFGAPCKDVHLPKAHIHTWLGFLDPPGQRFGPAIAAGALDPNHPAATAFIDWFKRMFDV